MLHTLAFATLLAAAAAAPATYDQRQDGDFNVRADVQNVIVVIAYPDKMKLPTDLFGGLKNNKHDEFQERADVVMEAFIEPSSPYRVEIGTNSERYADTDGRSVVVGGKRRLMAEPQDGEPQETKQQEVKPQEAKPQEASPQKAEPQATMSQEAEQQEPEPQEPEPLEAEPEEAKTQKASSGKEEFKLVGSREQCGPGRERDPITLGCRAEAPTEPQPASQPVQAAAQPEVSVVNSESAAVQSSL